MTKLTASKKFLANKGVVPRISFKDGQAHTVKILSDEADTITVEGKETEGIRYMVKESGEKRSFFTGSPYLVQQLAELDLAEEVTIQMKKRKKEDGSFVSYFEVTIPKSEDIDPKEIDRAMAN